MTRKTEDILKENIALIRRDGKDLRDISSGVFANISRHIAEEGTGPAGIADMLDSVLDGSIPDRHIYAAMLYCGLSGYLPAQQQASMPVAGNDAVIFRNALTERAAEIFRGKDGKLTLSDAGSYREACDRVSAAGASYTVIPLLDSVNGLLIPFASMTVSSSLFICDTVKIVDYENESAVVMALLRSAERPDDGREYDMGSFFFRSVSRERLSELTDVISVFGFTPVSITSVISQFADQESDHYMILEMDQRKADSFEHLLSYLHYNFVVTGRFNTKTITNGGTD